jgi:hypothetical protein
VDLNNIRMHSPSLSLSESNVLQDAQFFTTKAAIDAKINDLFSELKNKILDCQLENARLPQEIWTTAGRIHRGEHLGNFPWRAIDCPRAYNGKDIAVFRTLLVWGHEFSFHLILSGKWMNDFARNLSFDALAKDGWLLSLQESPWDWTLNDQSHVPLVGMPKIQWDMVVNQHPWIKISQPLSLTQFSQVPHIGASLWKNLVLSYQ